ncbi:MAG: patatin family protein [Mailhella sp.]|nr:patatin family protein [Mailhella sp.]
MKRALIMEGGAMRGMFTCGVIDVFMENEIAFDGAIGVSAGAVFGCNYKSRQIGRAIRYNKRFARDQRYCSLRSWIRTGNLYGYDFCYRILPDILDPFDREAFRRNPMPFHVVATDIVTGEPVFHLCTDGGKEDIEWMRASSSMPLVSRPVTLDGHLLLDGGISDPIPYAFMDAQGYDRNVVILTQPEGYRKKRSAAMPLMRLFMRKYPAIVSAMAERHVVYNAQTAEVARQESLGRVLVLRPPKPLGISRTESDPEELERVYQVGRAEAQRRIQDIKAFLKG